MSENDHVQISDFSDRELLSLINDLRPPVTAREVGVRIFGIKELEENEQEISRVSRCVTARFVWMRRYGLLDRVEWSRSDPVRRNEQNGSDQVTDDRELRGHFVHLTLA